MKKKITLSLIALLTAFLFIGGTLAYLTDKDEVTNTFTVGKVDITLDEAKVDLMGTPVEGAERVKANEYKLIPGHVYTKDPTVTVKANSEACYVRILVTANKVAEWTTIYGQGFDLGTIFNGYKAEDWHCHSITPNTQENTVVYEYRYKEPVELNKDSDTVLPALFTGFTMPTDLTGERLETINGFELDIVAHAIQADGFETAAAAWEKFPIE